MKLKMQYITFFSIFNLFLIMLPCFTYAGQSATDLSVRGRNLLKSTESHSAIGGYVYTPHDVGRNFLKSFVSLHSHNSTYLFGIRGYPARLAKYRRMLLQAIRSKGGGVIHVAHTIKVIIPSGQLFRGQTAYFYQQNMQVLNLVAALIKTYNVVNIGVDAYYGYYQTKDQQRQLIALTRQQANRVEDYLWALCTDTRLMSAHGHGIRNPVANSWHQQGRYYNSRVEVSFQYYFDRVL